MKETYSDFQRYGGKLTLNPIRNYTSKGTTKGKTITSSPKEVNSVDRSKCGRKSAVTILTPAAKERKRSRYYYKDKQISIDELRKLVKVSSSTLTRNGKIADLIEVNGYIIEIKDSSVVTYTATSKTEKHENLSLKEICEECGCSSPTIKRYANTDDLLYGVWSISENIVQES